MRHARVRVGNPVRQRLVGSLSPVILAQAGAARPACAQASQAAVPAAAQGVGADQQALDQSVVYADSDGEICNEIILDLGDGVL